MTNELRIKIAETAMNPDIQRIAERLFFLNGSRNILSKEDVIKALTEYGALRDTQERKKVTDLERKLQHARQTIDYLNERYIEGNI